MNGRVPDSLIWMKFRCHGCWLRFVHVQRGHDPIPPNDRRSPKSLCEFCKLERARIEQGKAPSYEDNLGDDFERDRIAGLLIDQAFGEIR